MKQEKEKTFTILKILPNLVTLLGLCIGLSAIRAALNGNWIEATACLLIAGFLDGIDGRLARFLNTTSEFGAQLDSLVDFVNSGIVPGIVIYLWMNQFNNVLGFDWAVVLFFAICMAIRLARFNVALDKEVTDPVLDKFFFSGIPAPCGAALVMLPMVLSYQFGNDYFYTIPKWIILYVGIIGVLVGSTVPTISIKKIPIRNEYILPTFLVLGSVAVGLVVAPWISLAVIGLIYISSIPVTIVVYFKLQNSYAKEHPVVAEPISVNPVITTNNPENNG